MIQPHRVDAIDPQRECAQEGGFNFRLVFGSGFCASFAMLSLAWFALAIGLPTEDYAGLFGTILNHGKAVAVGSVNWWEGVLWFFMNGTVLLPIVFLALATLLKSTGDWILGPVLGGISWLGLELVLKPAAGEGYFSSALPYGLGYATLSLLLSFFYGLLFATLVTSPLMQMLIETSPRRG